MDFVYLGLAIFLVFMNAFFVATEFSIVKLRPTKVDELIALKRPGALMVRSLVGNLDGYLAATQFGITLASLGLGWLGKPAFRRIIESPLDFFGITQESQQNIIAGILAFLIINVLHIVFGELVPKSLAILKPERIALAVAYPMKLFHGLMYPAIWTLNGGANLILRMMGLSTIDHSGGHSEDEIRIILNQARSAGRLSAERAEMLQKAMSLPTKTALDFMVPRNEVVCFDINLDMDENLGRASKSTHTRFPLCDRELDNVIGMVDLRDVLETMRNNLSQKLDLKDLATPPTYFPESMTGERLLAEFRYRRVHMAIIVDEYGGASGIVTPNDVVSAVMGELDEEEEKEVVVLPGGAYEVDGTAPLEEIEETLGIKIASEDMRTVAGFVMEKLGRMPRKNDRVNEQGFVFHITEVQGPKVSKIRMQKEPAMKEAKQPKP